MPGNRWRERGPLTDELNLVGTRTHARGVWQTWKMHWRSGRGYCVGGVVHSLAGPTRLHRWALVPMYRGVSCDVARAAEMTCRTMWGALHPKCTQADGRMNVRTHCQRILSVCTPKLLLHCGAGQMVVMSRAAMQRMAACPGGRTNAGEDSTGETRAAALSCCAQVITSGRLVCGLPVSIG